ncbi:acyltransferase domain-containing protein [Nocardia terpenica]|uniref:Malonyl-CoA:ACP transacylase (MAT) domain-containing protein n=1 Tax=Nocardia terpenica TaxID=455432 RepID=A0A291RFM5_9NOCA|nr:acyltransferase domain-containing protein [Nocardia terpenica]ATL66401.1 hypothetical protein CRH09_09480 [Nocardia terpenica]
MRTAFLFTGQGSQYPRMALPLRERHPEFRDRLAECDRLFRAHLDVSVADLMLRDRVRTDNGAEHDAETLLARTAYQQPALFAFEYALAGLWLAHGVRPDAVLGHSIGEIAAAAVAECLSLPDAVRLVAARGRLMQELEEPGAMLAVAAGVDRVRPVVEELELAAVLSFAAINAPDRCVLSGSPDAVTTAAAALRDRKMPSTRLKVSHAFHSPLMAPAAHALGAIVAELRFTEPRCALISALDGGQPDAAELSRPQHWVRHCLEPVDFAAAVRTAAARGPLRFVEIGPSHTLLKFGQRCAPDPGHLWLRSAAPGDDDCRTFTAALARAAEPADVCNDAPRQSPIGAGS